MEDDGAERIAAEWGVDVGILREADWELQEREGNDGEVYGYFVHFAEDNDPAVLAQLGLERDEFHREVSINAFDEPDEQPDIPEFQLSPAPRIRRPAYYIDGMRFTPSQFKRLSKGRKVEAMKEWFLGRFEDPSSSTSYITSEGGFLWNHGGPYDADDELQGEFQDLAPFELIELAVKEIESGGIYEWAPIHSDYTDDDYDRDLAFREREKHDGIYPIDEPFPDISEFIDDDEEEDLELPREQTYLIDENGRVLTDEHGRGLTVGIPGSSAELGGSALNEHTINGPRELSRRFALKCLAALTIWKRSCGRAQAFRRVGATIIHPN